MNNMSCFFATRKDGAVAVTFELTYECNLECAHCMNSSNKKNNISMPFNEATKLLEELKKNSVKSMYFTGGEPLLYPQIDKLLELSHNMGFTTRLATNGLELNNHITAVEKYVDFVSLSIDGIGEIHDKIRGKSGTFDVINNVLELAYERDISVVTSTMICGYNVHQLKEIILFSKEKHVKQMNFSFVMPIGRAKDNNMKLSKHQYKFAAKEILKLKEEHQNESNEESVPCYAGDKIVHITPNGRIAPCSWCDKAGFNEFCEQWHPGKLKDCLKNIHGFQTIVEKRKKQMGLNDCIAAAYIESGQLYSDDPLNVLLKGNDES